MEGQIDKHIAGYYNWRITNWEALFTKERPWEVRFIIRNVKIENEIIPYDEIHNWFESEREAVGFKDKFENKILLHNEFQGEEWY